METETPVVMYLSADEKAAFKELIADYGKVVRGRAAYNDGINPQIAAALVKQGWRKRENSN